MPTERSITSLGDRPCFLVNLFISSAVAVLTPAEDILFLSASGSGNLPDAIISSPSRTIFICFPNRPLACGMALTIGITLLGRKTLMCCFDAVFSMCARSGILLFKTFPAP